MRSCASTWSSSSAGRGGSLAVRHFRICGCRSGLAQASERMGSQGTLSNARMRERAYAAVRVRGALRLRAIYQDRRAPAAADDIRPSSPSAVRTAGQLRIA
jgi:hypothetical protein